MPAEVPHAGAYQGVLAALEAAGFENHEVDQIAWRNWRRVLAAAWAPELPRIARWRAGRPPDWAEAGRASSTRLGGEPAADRRSPRSRRRAGPPRRGRRNRDRGPEGVQHRCAPGAADDRAPTAASPMAPPTWNEVLTRPEARPCSWSATPAVAWMFSDGKPSAKPDADQQHRRQHQRRRSVGLSSSRRNST